MKKLLVLFVMTVVCMGSFAQVAKELPRSKPNVTVTDKGYVAISKGKTTGTATATGLTYTDSKGKVHPVYRSSNGNDYVLKTSAKTGKTYKLYMKSK
jgi:hypothetical protein